jgi:hypothetical protein
MLDMPVQAVPASYDWRTLNRVTRSKNRAHAAAAGHSGHSGRWDLALEPRLTLRQLCVPALGDYFFPWTLQLQMLHLPGGSWDKAGKFQAQRLEPTEDLKQQRWSACAHCPVCWKKAIQAMWKIPIIEQNPELQDSEDSLDDLRSLPDFYMADYSVLGILVNRLDGATGVLGSNGYTVEVIKAGRAAEVAVESCGQIRDILDLLTGQGICCSVGDTIDEVEIYRG